LNPVPYLGAWHGGSEWRNRSEAVDLSPLSAATLLEHRTIDPRRRPFPPPARPLEVEGDGWEQPTNKGARPVRDRAQRTVSLRFHLFGRFRGYRDGRPLKELDSHRTAELLAYLLMHRDRSHFRERLASDLWGGTSTRTSLKYLRQALWKLHAADPEPWSRVSVDREWLRLDTSAVHIDVAEFEKAFAATRGRSGFELDPTAAARLRAAADLYTGDLLADWDHEWCALERERLQSLYLLMLDKLMDFAVQHALPEVGLGYGATSLAIDAAREATHQRLMRLHYAVGNRTAALRQYERCASALAEELGVPPGRRTQLLREAIHADRGVAALIAEPSRRDHDETLTENLRRIQDAVDLLDRELAVAIDHSRGDS
jgi:DNA-binding SARP family transcriptional activator